MVLALLTYLLIAAVILVRWRYSGRSFGSFIGLGTVRRYARLWHGCVINAPVAVPATGPAILVANHTSSSDGTFLQVGSVRGLTFLFAREFYDGLPLLRWVWHSTGCVPVTRGVCDIRAIRQALRRLEEGRRGGHFPRGQPERSGQRPLADGQGRRGPDGTAHASAGVSRVRQWGAAGARRRPSLVLAVAGARHLRPRPRPVALLRPAHQPPAHRGSHCVSDGRHCRHWEKRGQGSGVRGQGSGVRGQGSGVRGQGSGVRGQGSGVRGQGSGVRGQQKRIVRFFFSADP